MPVQVLLSPIDTSNPFVLQLERSLPVEFVTMRFGWKRALFGQYTVFHIHWPERIVRGASRRKSALQQLLTVLLLARLTLLQTAVVRTHHNPRPHDSGSRVEGWLLKLIDRRTDHWVHLTSSEIEGLDSASRSVIPHGNYLDWYDLDSVPPASGTTLLFFGRIRPYKGIDSLLESVKTMDEGGSRAFHLRIAGRPTTPELARELEGFVAGTADISAVLRFIEDDELVREIEASRAVCLPYRSMGNSGALFLALSVGRPVIAPLTATNLEVQAEVGEAWMHLYEEPMTSDGLQSAWISATGNDDSSRPNLGKRDWATLGRAYGDAYGLALVARRGHRPLAGAAS